MFIVHEVNGNSVLITDFCKNLDYPSDQLGEQALCRRGTGAQFGAGETPFIDVRNIQYSSIGLYSLGSSSLESQPSYNILLFEQGRPHRSSSRCLRWSLLQVVQEKRGS